MRRIAVIGCGGAGKTTLARRLGAALGIEVVHADFLRHPPGGAAVSEDEWRARHAEVIERESWIFDGMKLSALDERLRAADTAIFLDPPRRACLLGLLRRRLRYRGLVDAHLGVADVVNLEFLRWAWRFQREYGRKSCGCSSSTQQRPT